MSGLPLLFVREEIIIMQKRHSDRLAYFEDSACTAREFYLPYVEKFHRVGKGVSVLEVGCGEGGNLLPFAERGCEVTGVDLSVTRIVQAEAFFEQSGYNARFVHADFLELEKPSSEKRYDVLLIHDVIEHIHRKSDFIRHAHHFLASDGIIFWGFPAWHMPFGGHQQVCKSRWCSHLPFIHLLPSRLYDGLLHLCGESRERREELLDIKRTRVSIERFERLLAVNGCAVLHRCLWLINPHYKRKFRLKPRKLMYPLSRLPYVRNFFSTSCFYITRSGEDRKSI